MAFDPQNNSLNIETDLATVEVNYILASLLACAVACITNDISEWYADEAMPSEEVFHKVEPFYNDEEPTDSATAATFLLLVREAVR